MAARRAGVPGFLLANFTWADIYAPHARRLGGDAPRPASPSCAGPIARPRPLFRAEPALRMADVGARLIEVGMVVTPGRDRRDELRKRLGLAAADRLVYFYVGRYGQDDLGWERLGALGARGSTSSASTPRRSARWPNLHVVPPDEWTGADLAASADAIVAKAGYGTACEAMVAGTPMIYPPRTGFAEHRALDRALRAWGGGVPLSARAFAELRLEPLARPGLRPRSPARPRSRPTAPPASPSACPDLPQSTPAAAADDRRCRSVHSDGLCSSTRDSA